MAPNFDNNIALISRDYPSDLERKNDLFIHDFLGLLDVEKIDYQIPALDEDMIAWRWLRCPSGWMKTLLFLLFGMVIGSFSGFGTIE
ncbi:MAG: hypothetical protein CVU99_04145 [Firmicutes bacterium HGW-Firmicutes-4]|jgi:hypothetical protein|nr:MAG: hypothetical protein CVU99_04145 [Firmicutes bacterium HGW-Firmicutes-4]